tara:strand:+ start:107 stop:493 length:387 start_codon:yes stop_codon:yes gene_type:complete
MKLDKILFWITIVAISLYVLQYLGFTNNTFENFVAGVNDYVETGGCYGNVIHPQNPSTHELLNETSTVFGHTLPSSKVKNAPLGEGEERLFMFGKNKCSPECCPSTYTCSGGCVCTTEEQRNRIHRRK